MRITKYFGKIWFIVEGKTKYDDDKFSIKIENYYRTDKTKYQLLSINKRHCFEIVIINIGIAIYPNE